MNSLGLQLGHSLQPTLSPRLQRAVKLLQMSSLDFSVVVRDALDTNPFLEADESAELLAAEQLQGEEYASGEPESDTPEEPGWGAEPLGRSRMVDGDGGVFDTLMAQTSLAGHLIGQLKLLPLSVRDATLAAAIAESLDDDGYLRTPLHEIAAAVPLLPPPDPDELLIALRHVQALEPAGVGARGVAECLELQLPSVPCAERALAATILRSHLTALASRDVQGIARKLGRSPADVERACAAIRRLDPHPGWRYGAPAVQYVVPDVIARKIRGKWTAVLNSAVVPKVRVNNSYADLFAKHRNEQHAELGGQLAEAKWTVRNVEQRFSTILSVAQAILGRQQHFLAYGAMAMKPLSLREIADEVGVHESTVSRVTNNKFMGTPAGVFELKYFFSRGLSTAAGGECSPTAIRSLIQEMIGAENPAQPLSDVDIARELSQQGLKVARRTVTKYRQLMKIGPAGHRLAARAPLAVDAAPAQALS